MDLCNLLWLVLLEIGSELVGRLEKKTENKVVDDQRTHQRMAYRRPSIRHPSSYETPLTHATQLSGMYFKTGKD